MRVYVVIRMYSSGPALRGVYRDREGAMRASECENDLVRSCDLDAMPSSDVKDFDATLFGEGYKFDDEGDYF